MAGWPRIDITHLSTVGLEGASPEVLATAERVSREGVPEELLGGRYCADEAITVMLCGSEPLVRFGTGLGAGVCVDPATGFVVTASPGSARSRFANSSLKRFVETARAITERFPFYSTEDVLERADAAASDVAAIVRSIEVEAIERDGFWDTMVEDIRMGDFLTETICGVPGVGRA
jgi:hypothetical protein